MGRRTALELKKMSSNQSKNTLKSNFYQELIKYLKDNGSNLIADRIEATQKVLLKPTQKMISQDIRLLNQTLLYNANFIEGLDLRNSIMRNSQVTKLLVSLNNNSYITKLNLSEYKINNSVELHRNLLQLLKNKTIKDISLSFSNFIQNNYVHEILDELLSNDLTSFSFDWYQAPLEIIGRICNILSKTPNLISFGIKISDIDFENAENLAYAVKSLHNLKNLTLSFINCDFYGAKAFAEVVNSMTCLSTCLLNIEDLKNKEFVVSFAKNHPKLTNLDLNFYQLNLDDSELFKNFKTLSNLTEINLSYNKISTSCALLNVAKLLKFLPNLTKLDLYKTPILFESYYSNASKLITNSFDSLINAVSNHPNITFINLPRTNLKAKHINLIKENLEHNFSITHLKFDNKSINQLHNIDKKIFNSIKKITSFNTKILKEVALFINKYFLDDSPYIDNICPMRFLENNMVKELSSLKKYQLVSKGAIKYKFKEVGVELSHGWNNKINNFINENFFQLFAICKEVKINTVHQNQIFLPKFIIAHISSFLGDKNIAPQISHTSINGNDETIGKCTIISAFAKDTEVVIAGEDIVIE